MSLDRWWSSVRRYDAGVLTMTSVALTIALLAVYAVAVRTSAGQRWDVAAFGDVSPLHDVAAGPASMLRDTAPLLLAVVAVALGALAVRRGRWRAALAGALASWASLVGATVMRDVVLERPMLGGHGYVQNTLPSGHVAVVTALTLAVLLLWPGPTPPRWAVLGGAGVVVAVAGASVVTYAHRPSDVVAGCLVGLLATVLACWLVRVPLAPLGPGAA